MTRKTFYRNLRKIAHKFQWFIEDGGIRGCLNGKRYCPITAVAKELTNKYYEPGEYPLARQNINLNFSDTLSIVEASDSQEGNSKRCRNTLIKAIGLTK